MLNFKDEGSSVYTTQHGVIQGEGKTPSTRCFEFDALAEVSGGRRVGFTDQGSGVRRRLAPGILLSRPREKINTSRLHGRQEAEVPPRNPG